jgi:hypothetical protein
MIGKYATVDGSGDLYFSADVRPIIHQTVYVNRQCKNGLYEVVYESNKYYVAKRNLTEVLE